LNVGLRDQVVFPEITPEQSPVTFSLGMSIVPKIKDPAKAMAMYQKLGVPLRKTKDKEQKQSKRKTRQEKK
jgi:ribosomal protein L5